MSFCSLFSNILTALEASARFFIAAAGVGTLGFKEAALSRSGLLAGIGGGPSSAGGAGGGRVGGAGCDGSAGSFLFGGALWGGGKPGDTSFKAASGCEGSSGSFLFGGGICGGGKPLDTSVNLSGRSGSGLVGGAPGGGGSSIDCGREAGELSVSDGAVNISLGILVNGAPWPEGGFGKSDKEVLDSRRFGKSSR